MGAYGEPTYWERFFGRIEIFFEGIWPSVYVLVNSLFYGIINFFKFILRGFFPGS